MKGHNHEVQWLFAAMPDLQPAERWREALNRYGTGWFWQPYDHNHAALVPMSTQYETPPLRWRHAEGCAVDRTHGFGCTCKTTEEKMNDGEE